MPRSLAQDLEEKLNNMEMWHLLVKPFVRLCTMKEAFEKSCGFYEFFDYFYEEHYDSDGNVTNEDGLDEDVVLFIAEGWGKYGVDDTVDIGCKTYFLTQTEGDDGYELLSGFDLYTVDDKYEDDDYGYSIHGRYGFGGSYVSELDENNMFVFEKIDEILSEIAPDFPKPRFKYLSQEELGDSHCGTMFLENDGAASDDSASGTPQNLANEEDFEIEDGVLVKYKGEGGDVTIPEGVRQIGKSAFSGCESLSSVAIPEGMTEIGERAFDGCKSLSSVAIPSSVTEIGQRAFCGCCLAEGFALEIAGWSFKNSLAIKDGAVEYCTNCNATAITIPEGVTKIGESAFNDCSSLSSVTIPEGVTEIGRGAFYNCTSLSSVTIPEGMTEIGERAFDGCKSLSSVAIPSSVTEIGERAFDGCKSLSSVAIPSSVTEIGGSAFEGCNFAEGFALEVAGWSFKNSLAIKDGVVKYLTNRSATAITIPEGVTKIGESAFGYCKSLSSVTIPEGVTKIGKETFYGCDSLSSVTIPSSVKEIGEEAFSGCSSLSSVAIPEGVTEIGEFAFSRCCLAENFALEVAGWSFKNSLAIKDGVVKYCTNGSATAITIPEGVKEIGYQAFKDCNITSVTIPKGVETIGVDAFLDSSLTSVTIPEGVRLISHDAFYECQSLESVTIPKSVEEIGDGAFDCCRSLESVTVPANTKIGKDAFDDAWCKVIRK